MKLHSLIRISTTLGIAGLLSSTPTHPALAAPQPSTATPARQARPSGRTARPARPTLKLQLAKGGIESATAYGDVEGWACDPKNTGAATEVHIYVGGHRFSSQAKKITTLAKTAKSGFSRPECKGRTAIRFKASVLSALPNTSASTVPIYAYVKDTRLGKLVKLAGSPKQMTRPRADLVVASAKVSGFEALPTGQQGMAAKVARPDLDRTRYLEMEVVLENKGTAPAAIPNGSFPFWITGAPSSAKVPASSQNLLYLTPYTFPFGAALQPISAKTGLSLAPGATRKYLFTVAEPSKLAAQQYTFVVHVDPQKKAVEANETNNTRAVTFKVTQFEKWMQCPAKALTDVDAEFHGDTVKCKYWSTVDQNKLLTSLDLPGKFKGCARANSGYRAANDDEANRSGRMWCSTRFTQRQLIRDTWGWSSTSTRRVSFGAWPGQTAYPCRVQSGGATYYGTAHGGACDYAKPGVARQQTTSSFQYLVLLRQWGMPESQNLNGKHKASRVFVETSTDRHVCSAAFSRDGTSAATKGHFAATVVGITTPNNAHVCNIAVDGWRTSLKTGDYLVIR